MSHKASHWLAAIPAEAMTAGAFRVLFHLCDAHNSQRDAATACFPSQEKLRGATGLSNGGLNKVLNALEADGFIRRRRTRNANGTRGPTYYILGCEGDLLQGPSPQSGGGGGSVFEAPKPVDKSVDKSSANSTLRAKPTPLSGVSQLHPSGVEPVIDPVKEPSRARAATAEPVERPPESAERRAEVVAEMSRKYPALIRPPQMVATETPQSKITRKTGAP